MAEVNIPDEAVEAGWWTSSGQDMREQDIREVVAAAAPLIVAAEITQILGERGDLLHDEWAEQVTARMVARLAELRGGRT